MVTGKGGLHALDVPNVGVVREPTVYFIFGFRYVVIRLSLGQEVREHFDLQHSSLPSPDLDVRHVGAHVFLGHHAGGKTSSSSFFVGW